MIFNFRLEVNNLTNELYSTSGEGDAFFPAAERNYILEKFRIINDKNNSHLIICNGECHQKSFKNF